MNEGLTETALGYLRDGPDQSYSPGEIADRIEKERRDIVDDMCKQNIKNERKSYRRAQMASQIGSALRNRVKKGVVLRDEGPPVRYRWVGEPDVPSVAPIPRPPSKARPAFGLKKSTRKEHDLYEPLRKYLRHKEIGSRRIDEKAATNTRGRKGNMWLYPDVVGMEILIENWEQDVIEIVKENADRKARFWSFEVKVELNMSSVREAYFQAVSNSSWANFGYLVAEKVDDEETLKELHMLFSLHGIGVIELNVENPKESRTVIPARERLNVDWANCDRIVKINRSFKEFMDRAVRNLRAGKHSPDIWDS